MSSVPRIWNGPVWIIGGGYSIIEQFQVPVSIYNRVANGEPESLIAPYLSPLEGQRVIGTNRAAFLGVADVMYFRDCAFYDDYGYEGRIVQEFKGLRFTSCIKKPVGRGIVPLKKGKTVKGLDSRPDHVCWNYDAGAAAINLAYHLGATKVLLLGYDMMPGPNGETHWHGGYVKKGNNRPVGQPFERFMGHHSKGEGTYDRIARDAEQLGLEIINANPNSNLGAFPKVRLEDLL